MTMARQESFTLFKKADIEGYLDKINSGITAKWLPGKSKVWCELYGTTLYIFKDSKRSSTEAQHLHMNQVHMVRKSASDKTGAHFEILTKNKQHAFCASSVGECDSWIRHLQTAMTLKDQDQSSPQESATLVGDYETIAILPEDELTTPRIKIGASSTLDPGYAEVEFQNLAATPKTSVTTTTGLHQGGGFAEDDGYAQVEFRSSRGSEPVIVKQIPKEKDSNQSQSSPVMEVDSYGYTKVAVRKTSVSDQSMPLESAASTEALVGQGDSYSYATVQRKTTPGTQVSKSNDTAHTAANEEAVGSLDEDLLIAAAQSKPDPIPPFPHPLELEDLQPLAALQDFLSSNWSICRPSFSDKTVAENPIDDMKHLLEELHL